MSRRLRRAAVELTLTGPFLTQATTASVYNLDATLPRHSAGGRYCLPGTLVKGRLRQSLVELNSCGPDVPYPIEEWLGAPSDSRGKANAGYDPRRTRLHFTDFEGPKVVDRPHRTRIQIDSGTGAVSEGMMQLFECPFAAGEPIPFRGAVEFVGTEAEAAEVRELLEAGLSWTPCFGANTSIGFGGLAGVTVSLEEPAAAGGTRAPSVRLEGGTCLDLVVAPQAPFVVAKRRLNGNTFESSDVISGAVIKGVIASQIRALSDHRDLDVTHVGGEWGALGRHLSDLVVGHAFPGRNDGSARPVVPPLSLITTKGKDSLEWYDAALCPHPILIDKRAPAFDIDWKERTRGCVWGDAAFGWVELERQLRVRPAVEYEKNRAADEMLFAYEMIVPAGREWRSRIDLSGVADAAMRDRLVAQLHALFDQPNPGLGKSKAGVRFRLVAPSRAAGPQAAIKGGLFVVTVQTPALLCDPTRLDAGDGGESLHRGYADAWRELSGGSLELSRFFARQSIWGGYVSKRFGSGRLYEPFVTTDPGSVFVLTAADPAAASTFLGECGRIGLPHPAWARARYGDSWKTNPFRREEGFGEIAVNLACHVEKDPRTLGGRVEVV